MKSASKNELPASYENTRRALLQTLSDKRNKVVALTGKWGTGKTHLWDQLSKANEQTAPKHIYVSVFGAKGASELKLRVLQDAYLRDKDNFKKLARAGGSILGSVAQTFLGIQIEDAALLWLPNLIKERLIVIDDIERKHANFDVDELLGFIDEFSERHNVQFLLLLNSDKLTDKDTWSVLHEKVIDVEIVLDPSAADAYAIASQAYVGPFKTEIGQAVGKLSVKNIRVLRKILSTFEKLASEGLLESESIAKRVVPSAVLLTAIHYRGLDDSITTEYVRTYQRADSAAADQNSDKNALARWNSLLSTLEIRGADDFEDIVCEFLNRGILDVSRLSRVLDRYRSELLHGEMNIEVSNFIESFWWDPRKSSNALLISADSLLQYASRLSPAQISEIVQIVEQLDRGRNCADGLLTAWISASNTRDEYRRLTEDSFTVGYKTLHPRISAQLAFLKQNHIPKLTVDDAIRNILANTGWGEREQRSFRESTIEEYEGVLRRLTGKELARFLFEHIDWLRKGPSDKNFVPGIENFKAVCQKIVVSDPNERLSQIIVRTFEDRGAKEHLAAILTT